jgi:hypothetical protein
MQRSKKWIWSVVGFGLLALAPVRPASPELSGEPAEGGVPVLAPHRCGPRQLAAAETGIPPGGIALDSQSMSASGSCDGGPRGCLGITF